ncbi:MAG: 2-succinylbenzoate--CoA ligase [Kiritimatiellia bacterium]
MECPLHRQALRTPDQPFLLSPLRSLSFRETDLLVSRWQRFFQRQGLLPGQKVVTLLPNSDDAAALLFACLREQLKLCPINTRLPERRIQEQIDLLRPGLVLRELPKLGNETATGFRVSENAPATLLFTSGSSGNPKAVSHTLANHLASAQSAQQHAPLAPGDRWLCSLPFYHVGGLAILFRTVLAGAACVFPEQGEGGEAAVLRTRPTHVSWVPTQLHRWIESGAVHSFRRILLGGAPVSGALLRQALDLGLPVATSYGMTETASQVASTPPGEAPEGAGRLMPGVELKIGPQQEILLLGKSISAACLGSDGWLHTGDCGRLERGRLYVEGRMDLQFISGGENIQPELIERALTALPGIQQAVVVPCADPEFGQRPLAWVDAEITPERIRGWTDQLRREIPGYMLPVDYRRLPESNGLKPDRQALMQRGT